MPFPTHCPACQQNYTLPDTHRHMRVRCRQCGGTFQATPEGENPAMEAIPVEVPDLDEPEIFPRYSANEVARKGRKIDNEGEVEELPVPTGHVAIFVVACIGLALFLMFGGGLGIYLLASSGGGGTSENLSAEKIDAMHQRHGGMIEFEPDINPGPIIGMDPGIGPDPLVQPGPPPRPIPAPGGDPLPKRIDPEDPDR